MTENECADLRQLLEKMNAENTKLRADLAYARNELRKAWLDISMTAKKLYDGNTMCGEWSDAIKASAPARPFTPPECPT
jgi:hypothetical protein